MRTRRSHRWSLRLKCSNFAREFDITSPKMTELNSASSSFRLSSNIHPGLLAVPLGIVGFRTSAPSLGVSHLPAT
ncbi:hypothetical protein EJ05DRAFT_242390 [Pseudovirgaria hyperparasitica]|uniref:Uncharacterized protein n=1 Tax=Pseudovirgaria hyperparasitica TaxID=470096 RepID=A0A6A6WF44_9PEZI|nr:uncharacterized protein EJ05DRAFT_242390 [Pseudovirgaria hyperparasitica]KAF2760779.1 hypothetical protein EJ05DRAFT_242390 [Pseudovirgaria hyperparasitica]